MVKNEHYNSELINKYFWTERDKLEKKCSSKNFTENVATIEKKLLLII